MYRVFGIPQCPYVHRIRIGKAVRDLKDDVLRVEWIDLNNPPPELVANDPTGWTVPTLIDASGKGFDDSLTILEFLDSLPGSGPRLFGDTPWAVAETKALNRRLTCRFLRPLRRAVSDFGNAGEKLARTQGLAHGLEALQAELKHDGFFGGDSLNATDVVLAPFVRQLFARHMRTTFNVDTLAPRLRTYLTELANHPVVQEFTLPDDERDRALQKWHELPAIVAAVAASTSEPVRLQAHDVGLINTHEHPTTAGIRLAPWHLAPLESADGLVTQATWDDPQAFVRLTKSFINLQETVGAHCTMEIGPGRKARIFVGKPGTGISRQDLAMAQAIHAYATRSYAYGEEPTSEFD